MVEKTYRIRAKEFAGFASDHLEVWDELVGLEVEHQTDGKGTIVSVEQREKYIPLIYVTYSSSSNVAYNSDSFKSDQFTSLEIPRHLLIAQSEWYQKWKKDQENIAEKKRILESKVAETQRRKRELEFIEANKPTEQELKDLARQKNIELASKKLEQYGFDLLAKLTFSQQSVLAGILGAGQRVPITAVETKNGISIDFREGDTRSLENRFSFYGMGLPLVLMNAMNLMFCIQHLSTTMFQYAFRPEVIPDYGAVLSMVAKHFKVDTDDCSTQNEVEIRVSNSIFELTWSKLTQDQKKSIENELLNMSKLDDKSKEKIKVLGLFGALATAQLSGFGVYILASTTLSVITGVFGLTMPFAFYAGISSLISVAIGPVGWLAGAVYAIYKFDTPKYKVLIPLVLFMTVARLSQELEPDLGIADKGGRAPFTVPR